MNIIITGSLAYDRIMDFPGRFREHILPDKIHILNVSFTVENLSEQFGGTAGNIAYNLKLLGLQPTIISAAGADFNRYAEYLRGLGINPEHIKIFSDKHTAVATMVTDLDDNQISAFYPGALALGAEVEIPNELAASGALLIIAPSSRAEMIKRALWAREQSVPYIFDPGQQTTTLSGEESAQLALSARAAIFNDYEWELFQNKAGLGRENLTGGGVAVIVTRGQAGSVIYSKDKEYQIGIAKPNAVLDPTGAGDAYRAGIAAGIVKNWNWQVAGQAAATIASFVVEKYGTQTHRLTLEMFNDRYGRSFRSASPFIDKDNKL